MATQCLPLIGIHVVKQQHKLLSEHVFATTWDVATDGHLCTYVLQIDIHMSNFITRYDRNGFYFTSCSGSLHWG